MSTKKISEDEFTNLFGDDPRDARPFPVVYKCRDLNLVYPERCFNIYFRSYMRLGIFRDNVITTNCECFVDRDDPDFDVYNGKISDFDHHGPPIHMDLTKSNTEKPDYIDPNCDDFYDKLFKLYEYPNVPKNNTDLETESNSSGLR